MTTGPTDAKVTTAAGGPGGMPLALRLSEGLGPNAQDVERKELTAALDKSGSVVLIDHKGDIVFYAADGKMQVQRLGQECDACIAANLRLAEAVAQAWNTADEIEQLRAAISAVVREPHDATAGIIALHILDGRNETNEAPRLP